MNILNIISSLNPRSGGPSLSTVHLVKSLNNYRLNSHILTFNDGLSESFISDHEKILKLIGSSFFTRKFKYTSQLVSFFRDEYFYEIYHAHGLWEFPSHCASKFSRLKNIPLIISPRGMLYPEALKISPLKKKLALRLYQKKNLDHAHLIHATSIDELFHLRNFGLKNPIAVIPNFIDNQPIIKIEKAVSSKKKLGFLGRLVPIKNLEVLLKAWSITGSNYSDWELVFVGDGDKKYRSSLESLALKLGIRNFRITGFLFGLEKEKEFQEFDFLVLPSKSENFGMVVLESLVRGIPVIATQGTPWNDLNLFNAGWWIENSLDQISETIKKAILISNAERNQMVNNGYRLVKEKYSQDSVSRQMIDGYEWVLKGGQKPSFIYE